MRRSYFAGVFGVHGFKGPHGADVVTNFNFSAHSFHELLVLWVVQDNVVLVRVGEGLEGSKVDDTFDFEDLNVKGNAGKGGGGGGGSHEISKRRSRIGVVGIDTTVVLRSDFRLMLCTLW